MPFPGSVATVIVTKDYRDANGEAPKRVTVRFRPSARKVLTSQDITIEPIPVTRLVTNGLLSVVLAATDGFSYEVSETVDGKQRPPFNILVPAATPTPTYVLDELAPIEPVTPQYTPVRTVEGVGPDAGGNVDLNLSGGGPHTHPESDVTNLVSDLASKANTGHTHAQSDVTGLAGALAGKENTGVAAGLVSAHEAASDPHPQYLTSTEGNEAYSALGHTHPISNVTGLQTALDGKVPASLVDAKGDLIVASSDDTVARLAVGVNGQVLTADSAQASGMKWATPSGGSGIKAIRRAIIAGVSDTTLPNTAGVWAAVSGFEIAIPAAVDDEVELLWNAMRNNNANALIDVAVLVGSELRRFGANNGAAAALEGNPAFYHTNTFTGHSGGFDFKVTANDLDGSNVRFVVACKGNGSGTLYSSTSYPFRWRAINYGVVTG